MGKAARGGARFSCARIFFPGCSRARVEQSAHLLRLFGLAQRIVVDDEPLRSGHGPQALEGLVHGRAHVREVLHAYEISNHECRIASVERCSAVDAAQAPDGGKHATTSRHFASSHARHLVAPPPAQRAITTRNFALSQAHQPAPPPPAQEKKSACNHHEEFQKFQPFSCAPTWGSSVPPMRTRHRGRARGRSSSLPSCTALPHTHPRTVNVSMMRLRSASPPSVPPGGRGAGYSPWLASRIQTVSTQRKRLHHDTVRSSSLGCLGPCTSLCARLCVVSSVCALKVQAQ